jgi:uncharacterized HAD superfamily protein
LVAGIPPELVLDNMARAAGEFRAVRAFLSQVSRPRIVSDIDGTLAERDVATCLVINAKFGTDYHYDDVVGPDPQDWLDDEEIIAWVDKHHHTPQFLSNLTPYQDGQWALWSLRSGGYHVTISSDREVELTTVSKDWLDQWAIPYDEIDIGDDHKLAIAEKATPDDPVAFFDDSPKRAEDLPRPGVTVYLLDRPWNQEVGASDRVIRVKTWPEALSYFPAQGADIVKFTVIQKDAAWDEGSHQRDEHGQFTAGGGGKPTGNKPIKLPTPKSGDHVRVRQWSDGKWRIQHKDANQKVVDHIFQSRTEAIQHAHSQGWSARTGTMIVHPGMPIPAEPPPKPGQGKPLSQASLPQHPQVGPSAPIVLPSSPGYVNPFVPTGPNFSTPLVGGKFTAPTEPLAEKPTAPAPPPPPQQYKTEMQFKVEPGAGTRVRAASSASQAKMTSTAQSAIQAYTGSWYSHINGALRGGIESLDDEKRIAAMDAALGQSATSENVVVGRTVGSGVLQKFVQAGVGGKVTDHGYVSTSLYKSGVNETGKQLSIQLPKGSPGLNVMPLSGYGEVEAEFLLPRSSQFRVVSVSPSGDKVTAIYLGTHLSEQKPDVAGAHTAVQVPVNPVPSAGPQTLNPKVPSLQSVLGAGATKIEGPHGSQPGQWYKMAAGQEVYVKPMTEARAHNEVGARVAYNILGGAKPGEVPPTAVVQDKTTGQFYVASPKLSGLQTLSASQWTGTGAVSESARAAASQQWATDALLSHWDAVGLAHDNMALNAAGGVSRIDTGGAMEFRAQGATKDNWSVTGAWQEPYTMRGIGGNNPAAKNVFGRMTNQQASEALGKLRAGISQDSLRTLRQLWHDQGMSKAANDKNMAVIVERLNRIPEMQKALMASPGTAATP